MKFECVKQPCTLKKLWLLLGTAFVLCLGLLSDASFQKRKPSHFIWMTMLFRLICIDISLERVCQGKQQTVFVATVKIWTLPRKLKFWRVSFCFDFFQLILRLFWWNFCKYDLMSRSYQQIIILKCWIIWYIDVWKICITA